MTTRDDAYNQIIEAADVLYDMKLDLEITSEREQQLKIKITELEEEVVELKHAISNAAYELEQYND